MGRNCLIALVAVLSTVLIGLIGYVGWKNCTENAVPEVTVPTKKETAGNTESTAPAVEVPELGTSTVTENTETNTEPTGVTQQTEATEEATADTQKVSEPEKATDQMVPTDETTVPNTEPEETTPTVATTSTENDGLGENELPPM